MDSFNHNFQLEKEQQETLDELLYSDLFCQQVGGKAGPAPPPSASTPQAAAERGAPSQPAQPHPLHMSLLPLSPLPAACCLRALCRRRLQVVRDCKLPEGTQVEFTGILFQPVPW